MPVKIDKRIASLNQCQENHSGVISFSADICSVIRKKYTIIFKDMSVNRYIETILILNQFMKIGLKILHY